MKWLASPDSSEHTIMRVPSLHTISRVAGPNLMRPLSCAWGVLAVALLILASGLESSASLAASEPSPADKTVSDRVAASVRSHAIEPVPHHCRCGTDCGGSCCCNRRDSRRASTIKDTGALLPSTGVGDGAFGHPGGGPFEHARPGRPQSASSANDLDAGPCVSRFPCGGDTIPTSSSPLTRSIDSALLSGRQPMSLNRAGEKLPLAPAACLAQSATDPLDKPPRASSCF
jgi:hypothetical protein